MGIHLGDDDGKAGRTPDQLDRGEISETQQAKALTEEKPKRESTREMEEATAVQREVRSNAIENS